MLIIARLTSRAQVCNYALSNNGRLFKCAIAQKTNLILCKTNLIVHGALTHIYFGIFKMTIVNDCPDEISIS